MENPLPRLLEWARFSRIRALEAEVARLSALAESQARQLIEGRAREAAERERMQSELERLEKMVDYFSVKDSRRPVFGVLPALPAEEPKHEGLTMSMRQARGAMLQQFLNKAAERAGVPVEEAS